jgi:DNA-binding transcriptional LysR family regulator
MNPSLGWIQAFMCVADHLDYALAGQDLGINANRAKQRVHKLGGWLGKVLFNDHPIQLTAGDGEAFIPIAWAVLQKADAACPAQKDETTADYFARRAAKISEIHLDDLERFLSVAQQGSYKGAASILDCDVTTVQRSIQALEDVTGSRLFSGRSILALTDDGVTFRDTAGYIAQALNDFRAVSSDHYGN